MNFSPVTLVLVGFAAVLAGGSWAAVALLRRGDGGWRTALGLAAAFAAGAAGLSAVERTLALAGAALSAASLLFAFLRSGLPARLARASSRPLTQAALLGVTGLALVAFGTYRIDADLVDELDFSAKEIAAAGAPDLGPSAVAAHTDVGTSVPLWDASADDAHPCSEKEFLDRMRLNARLIQTGPADGDYNCHGWVFTGGRCWVRGSAVGAILKDNGYHETDRPAIGDLCVFRDGAGEVSHTAVVRGLGANGLVLLESKWGRLGRYIHLATESHAYVGHTPTYYRTERGTHLLAGLDGSRAEPVMASDEDDE